MLPPVGDAEDSADEGDHKAGLFQLFQRFRLTSGEPHDAQGIADETVIIGMEDQVHIECLGIRRQHQEAVIIGDF